MNQRIALNVLIIGLLLRFVRCAEGRRTYLLQQHIK